MERATKYLSAYHEELGVDLNQAAGSTYAYRGRACPVPHSLTCEAPWKEVRAKP